LQRLAGLWAWGDTILKSMNGEDAAAGAVGVMVLRPGDRANMGGV